MADAWVHAPGGCRDGLAFRVPMQRRRGVFRGRNRATWSDSSCTGAQAPWQPHACKSQRPLPVAPGPGGTCCKSQRGGKRCGLLAHRGGPHPSRGAQRRSAAGRVVTVTMCGLARRSLPWPCCVCASPRPRPIATGPPPLSRRPKWSKKSRSRKFCRERMRFAPPYSKRTQIGRHQWMTYCPRHDKCQHRRCIGLATCPAPAGPAPARSRSGLLAVFPALARGMAGPSIGAAGASDLCQSK